jgi:hypothetical protein
MGKTAEEKHEDFIRQRFADLNVGFVEEIDKLSIGALEEMVDTLEVYQSYGLLNIETDEGINNLKLIIDCYLEPPESESE